MSSTVSVPSPSELAADVEAYRAARVRRLTAEQGWLTVIGKEWLNEGSQRIGAADDAAIVLPSDRSPAHLATVTREGGVVRFDMNASVDVRQRGEKVGSAVLRRDVSGDELTFGSLTLELLWRGDDVAVRVRDREAPARISFAVLPAFPIDPTWFVVARLEPFAGGGEKEVVYQDGDGRPQVYLSPGAAVFERTGQVMRIEPVYESDRKRLFVLFSDLTNRDATYGAGRFLYAALPTDAGEVVLDFNKAYNPPCAFSPYVACPLPPRENHLAVRVEAGEKRPL